MKNVFLLLSFISVLLLSGCGGGGSSTPAANSNSAPAAPGSLILATANTQITPTWAAVSGATSYNVYYSTASGVTTTNGTKVANATSGAPITGLTNGTTYYVAATAVNAVGESALSAEVSATPAVAAPTGVTVISGNAQATVSWSAAAGATSYNVYYGTVAGITKANQSKVIGATSGSAITGLANGTKYYFVVTAVNASSESVVSAEVNTTPVAPPPPLAAPVGVTVASGNAQATLTWQAVTGATSYNVYYRTTPGVTAANGTKITNTSSGTPLTGLTNGTTYYFVVVTVNGGGEGAISHEVGATPQAPAVGVPSGLVITGGNGQVTLSWSAVTGATSYNVYYGTAPGVTIANGTKVTGATSGSAITGLTNGSQHFFVVTAMSNANTIENPASAEASATPMGIPNLVGGTIQTPLTLAGVVTNFAVSAPFSNGGVFNTFALTTDGKNLYVDSWAQQSKVEIATGLLTNLTGTFLRSDGHGITTDGNNLYTARSAQVISRIVISAPSNPIEFAGGYGSPGSVDGIGSAARFNTPSGITMYGANLYVADTNNHTIRKVVIATGAVTTIAGTAGLTGTTNAIGAAARFNSPQGITTDGTNLYVADTGNNLIRKVVIADGTVSTVAGGFLGLTYDGTGAGAKFTAPRGITTDGTNLYVADTGAFIIRKIVIATGVVTTIAGSPGVAGNSNGTGSAARFSDPYSITTDGISLYVGDYTNGVIRKIQ